MEKGNWQFDDIYETFKPKIQRYLCRMISNEEDAEDLTQEVFIKVNKGLPHFRGECSVSTWIYKIASNLAKDSYRSVAFQKSRKRVLTKVDTDFYLEDKSLWSGVKEPAADQQMVKKEMERCLQEYLDDLNEDYRTVLILSDYEGFKNKEIAEILGVSLDTVKIRLHRGRVKLRKRMERSCQMYYDDDGRLSCDKKH